MKVVSIVGARPQFVKAAAVSRALKGHPEITELLVHTGQHYDDNMSEIFFEQLEIPRPAHRLGIGSASHGAQTGRMLEALEQVLLVERPDWTLIFGDTNSTLAGALAATKLHMRVAHVEAGLRSFNRRMPEEINRVVADQLADLLLAPTQGAAEHLKREGVADGRIRLVGDVMYDAALYYTRAGAQTGDARTQLGADGEYVLATIHRAENTDDPERLRAIVMGLLGVARHLKVIWPLHPRTRSALERTGLLQECASRLRLEQPLGYLEMLAAERGARVIATDSGGVQKEAFFFRVPCRTLRDETEWTELVSLGWNRLVPPVSAEAVESGILSDLDQRGREDDPYGGGTASNRIAEALLGLL